MAINKYSPHLYDAEYAGNGSSSGTVREIVLFNRSASTSINYTDAAGSAINRAKGFEDTNLTENGRVTETGMILRNIGLNIVPGDPITAAGHLADRAAFFERGFVEFILNESNVLFTARVRDLVMPNVLEVSGGVATTASATTLQPLSLKHSGLLYDASEFRIPRGVRFKMVARWDRPLTLQKTARIEAVIYADAWDSDSDDKEAKKAVAKQFERRKAPPVKV